VCGIEMPHSINPNGILRWARSPYAMQSLIAPDHHFEQERFRTLLKRIVPLIHVRDLRSAKSCSIFVYCNGFAGCAADSGNGKSFKHANFHRPAWGVDVVVLDERGADVVNARS
jgi:hypothetical protein